MVRSISLGWRNEEWKTGSFYLSLGYNAAHHRSGDGDERQLSAGFKR